MPSKQSKGLYSPDGSKYAVFTDGAGNLTSGTTTSLGTTKQSKGSQAPDGSIYITVTDGNNSLV